MKYQQKYLAIFLSILLLASTAFGWSQSAAPAASRPLSATEQQLVDNLSVATIKDVVNALAADEMQGRGTAQPGGDKAAAYIADRFKKLGLKPLGANTSYLQPIKFKETQFLPQTAFTLGTESLKFGTDYFVSPPLSVLSDATFFSPPDFKLSLVAFSLGVTLSLFASSVADLFTPV